VIDRHYAALIYPETNHYTQLLVSQPGSAAMNGLVNLHTLHRREQAVTFPVFPAPPVFCGATKIPVGMQLCVLR